MAVHLSNHGFRFEYPDGWQLVEEPGEDRHVVTVGPDETTFWSATLLFDRPDPQEVLDSVVLAFEEEFREIDVHTASAKLAGLKAESRVMEFVCRDLTNSAVVHAARNQRFTLFVLSQFTDSEQSDVERVLQAITRSLKLMEPPDTIRAPQ
jgi:hypothetical protein